MKTLQLAMIMTLSLTVIFLVTTQHAFADTCSAKLTSYNAPQYYLLSDGVFAGTVQHIDNTTDHQWKVYFTVDKLWRGSISQKPLMVMTNSLQGCGYSIVQGEKYLVYTNGYPPFFNTVWSKPYADAQSDIAIIDDPKFQSDEKTQEELNKKLVIARDSISNLMGSKMGNIPFNSVGVDVINSTLDIGIDSAKAVLSEEEYEKKIKDIVGDIPIKITFGQIFTNAPIVDTLAAKNSVSLPLSPLKQFRAGTFAQGVHCNTGLQLFFKAEDYTPVCAQSGTATALLKRGWATIHPPEPFVGKIAINGLQQNYTIGQPINATVNYAGYYWYAEPEVKILDPNGTQIWFNCAYCYARSEPVPHPLLDAFTYIVRDYASNKHPVINKTGTYTMIASLENKTASAEFTIVKPLMSNKIIGLENDTGIVTFGNRTYYFETPHYTQDAYVNPVQISFHGVVFTLFPPGFKGGLPTNFGGVAANGCSGSYFWTDAKFPDDTHVLLNIFAMTTMNQQCLALPAPTYFSTHTDPLAGLTFYDGKLKLLVSVEGMLQQNNSIFSTQIPTNETIYHDFPQPHGYSIINSTQGIVVNNDAEASNLTGFSVKSPTDLPQGYKVKLIKASKEIPLVTIFVSKYPLTENATSEDFLWNQQGILITYDKTSPHELENFNQIFPPSTNKIITINGTLAVVSDISKEYNNGYPYDMWGSLLAIQNNNTNIAIRGFFNSDDLIKMATSMLEK